MNIRGSILMLSLWILAILSVFALGIGHRASINLKLARYQRDTLNAYCLAKAGVELAMRELDKDQNKYDSLDETWSTGLDTDNKPLLENIELKEGSGEKFTVRYLYDKEKDTYLCMEDEERKLNLNVVGTDFQKQILVTLFESALVEKPRELQELLFKWINSAVDKEDTEKIFKNAELKAKEELLIILEYFYKNEGRENAASKAREIYNRVKDLITVYSEPALNINTVSKEALQILLHAAVKRMQDISKESVATETEIQELLNSIISFRSQNKYFENVQDINNKLGLHPMSPEAGIIDFLISQGAISAASKNFRIEATGSVNKVYKKITVIAKRPSPAKIVYWHEN